MNKRVETCIVETENGPVTINACDYDPDVHTLVDAPTPVDADTGTTQTGQDSVDGGSGDTGQQGTTQTGQDSVDGGSGAAQAPSYAVQEEGGTFFVSTTEGKRVTGTKGIATKGYATSADAWAAIMALNTAE